MRLILLLIATMILPAESARADESVRNISVNGSAEVEVVPDIVSIVAGVDTTAETAAQALAGNAAAMTAVFEVLEASGIEAADYQTSRLTLNLVWDDGQDRARRIVGYQASNMLAVRVRDTAAIGGLFDSLGASGVNRIQSISFGMEDPEPHLNEARRRAVAAAQAKASLLADAAGVRLGPILKIREGNGSGPVRQVAMRANLAMDTPVAEGLVSLSAEVVIEYLIE
jgi:uncharacterized protein YggE